MCSILSERRGSIYQYVINFYMKIDISNWISGTVVVFSWIFYWTGYSYKLNGSEMNDLWVSFLNASIQI